MANAIDPAAHSFSTQNAAAFEAWGQGKFDQAVELDPDFGAAWRGLVQTYSSEPTQAAELAGNALARTSLRGPLERAQLALLSGQLRQDPAAVSQASVELVRLVPNDSGLARKLADDETAARHFEQAVRLYQRVIELEPNEPILYNLLGYAQFFAGDLPAARKSLDEYFRHQGQEANALDSQGEVLFMAGQFAQAETYFLRAHEINPDLLQGADLQKAAYARWLSGDLPGADQIFEKYMKYRSDHADATVSWRRASWEYATGRQAAALDRQREVTGPTAQLAQGQLQILLNRDKVLDNISSDLAALDQSYRRAPASADGVVRVLYARGLLKAGMKAVAE
jgi:tetratricopeptide (TPR) repeat protein